MADETVIEQETPAPVVPADAPLPEPVPTPEPVKETALNKMQARINELTWRLRETERRAQAPAEPPAKVEPKAPRLEDFAFDEAKFQAAQTEYLAHAARLAAREEFARATEELEAGRIRQSFAEREAAYAAKNPGYRERVYESGVVPISDAMADVIKESEIGPEIADYFANHREEAMQLYQLPPSLAGREIGKIEAKLAKPATTPVVASVTPIVPKVSNAPPPPAKIDADEPQIERDPAKMSDAEFAKWRRRQIAQRK